MLKRLILAAPLLFTAAGCPGCETVEITPQTKRIAVDVCAQPEEVHGKGGTQECNLAFDLTSLSARVQRNITISNVGEEELVITGYEFSQDSDPSFLVEHYPDKIKPGLSSQMVISFRPLLETQVSATLTFQTDAANVTEGKVVINITGNGVNNGIPHLQVDVVRGDDLEACCDLGLVAVGSTANCQLRLTNTGEKDLVLEDVRFDPEHTTGPWGTVGATPDPTDSSDDARFTIAPGESKPLSFRFQPTDLTAHGARVLIASNAPQSCGPSGEFESMMCMDRTYPDPCPSGSAGVVSVDLRGQGAEPPTCVARIKSVNGSTSFDPRLIEPLDDVEITAEDSTTSVPGLTIESYKWTITRKPPGSGVRLSDDTAESPRFVFDNTSTNIINGLDVAGDYEVRCEAIDSRGTRSINDGPSIIYLSATPSEAIHGQLVWDAPETDVDLHLVREFPLDSGTYERNSDNDCYYANCKPTTSGPIWDTGNEAHQGGNPVLDVDDVQGYGPENSNVNEPLPGRYKVIAHYFSDHGNGPTVATLRMYIYGNLVAEHTRLINDGEWWEVGVVEWPEQGAASWTGIDALAN